MEYAVATNSTYTNNTDDWILGRLTSATVTKSMSGKPSIAKTSNFAYDNKGSLKQEVLLPSECQIEATN